MLEGGSDDLFLFSLAPRRQSFDVVSRRPMDGHEALLGATRCAIPRRETRDVSEKCLTGMLPVGVRQIERKRERIKNHEMMITGKLC